MSKSSITKSGATHAATKKLVFSAMGIALAMVTSYIKVWEMPMGGSITLMSMLFICLIGYWFGPKYGLLAGAAYGLLQFIVDPYMLTIPQVILDYPLAFGALGLSGFSVTENMAFRLDTLQASWDGSSARPYPALSSSPLLPRKV